MTKREIQTQYELDEIEYFEEVIAPRVLVSHFARGGRREEDWIEMELV